MTHSGIVGMGDRILPGERPIMTRYPRLISLATATPPHVLQQTEVEAWAGRLFADALRDDPTKLQIFRNAQIDRRRLCVPLEWFETDHSFGEKNDVYIDEAIRLGGDAARGAIARAGLSPSDVDHIVFVSSTGLATPSLDVRIANALGLRSDCRRTPLWGLGCAGGAVGLAHAMDFARADPTARILLVAVELCSLTFQRNDLSARNLVATSLFGDGAAAAIVVGGEVTPFGADVGRGGRRLHLLASGSTLWEHSVDVMGWTVDGDGLHVVFSREIPELVQREARANLTKFLESRGLTLATLDHFVVHPGGVKVLRAFQDALDLPETALHHARETLREFGNMSSPSCLFVLERYLEAGEIGAGESAVLAALGPGFASEYVLMRGAAD